MPDDTRIPLATAGTPDPGRRESARAVLGEPRTSPHRQPHDLGYPPAGALYVHTPFCVHKCHYCDFYSFVDSRDQQAAFVDRLIREFDALAPHAGPLESIFVGGGTPSLLRVELWSRVLRALHTRFDLTSPALEFTVECNPESASPDLLATLRAGGVNRVSLGAQSFQPRHLKTLERWHDPENVARAVEAARAAGIARQSVDLIYAIPGQTLAEWESDLRAALALRTTHLSCYNLTYEPNTAMTVRLKRGEFEPLDEDLEADMFELTGATLAGAGLERYEVSNYARPGDECRHNLTYWRQGAWLAAGPSASGHVWASPDRAAGGCRWKNTPSLGVYLDHDDAGYAPIADHEPADPARALRERIMTGIRLGEGLDAGALLADAARVQPACVPTLERKARGLRDDGLLRLGPDRWTIHGRGWLLADWIAKRLMACVG
jgi:oxygen-independent coproporphyrinogen-3 oxidase